MTCNINKGAVFTSNCFDQYGRIKGNEGAVSRAGELYLWGASYAGAQPGLEAPLPTLFELKGYCEESEVLDVACGRDMTAVVIQDTRRPCS